MPTHTLGRPKVFRNFWMPPSLDLWLMKFCDREGITRSRVFQQALVDFLQWHFPEGAPTGSIVTILEERWAMRGKGIHGCPPNGPSEATFEQSSAMKLHKKRVKDQNPDPENRGRKTA